MIGENPDLPKKSYFHCLREKTTCQLIWKFLEKVLKKNIIDHKWKNGKLVSLPIKTHDFCLVLGLCMRFSICHRHITIITSCRSLCNRWIKVQTSRLTNWHPDGHPDLQTETEIKAKKKQMNRRTGRRTDRHV